LRKNVKFSNFQKYPQKLKKSKNDSQNIPSVGVFPSCQTFLKSYEKVNDNIIQNNKSGDEENNLPDMNRKKVKALLEVSVDLGNNGNHKFFVYEGESIEKKIKIFSESHCIINAAIKGKALDKLKAEVIQGLCNKKYS